MKIRILPAALEDLAGGREFYAGQSEGVGDYFTDCLFSDIDSLALYAGIHLKVIGYFRLLSKRTKQKAESRKWKAQSRKQK